VSFRSHESSVINLELVALDMVVGLRADRSCGVVLFEVTHRFHIFELLRSHVSFFSCESSTQRKRHVFVVLNLTSFCLIDHVVGHVLLQAQILAGLASLLKFSLEQLLSQNRLRILGRCCVLCDVGLAEVKLLQAPLKLQLEFVSIQ